MLQGDVSLLKADHALCQGIHTQTPYLEGPYLSAARSRPRGAWGVSGTTENLQDQALQEAGRRSLQCSLYLQLNSFWFPL